jgi:hypothetical protein
VPADERCKGCLIVLADETVQQLRISPFAGTGRGERFESSQEIV